MCKYCQAFVNEPLTKEGDWEIDIYVSSKHNATMDIHFSDSCGFSGGSSGYIELDINYCPKCGRNLSEDFAADNTETVTKSNDSEQVDEDEGLTYGELFAKFKQAMPIIACDIVDYRPAPGKYSMYVWLTDRMVVVKYLEDTDSFIIRKEKTDDETSDETDVESKSNDAKEKGSVYKELFEKFKKEAPVLSHGIVDYTAVPGREAIHVWLDDKMLTVWYQTETKSLIIES